MAKNRVAELKQELKFRRKDELKEKHVEEVKKKKINYFLLDNFYRKWK